MGYFSAHNHTAYSNASLGFADAINSVNELVDYALELNMSGIAITEHEALSSHVQLIKYRDKLEKEGKINHDDFTIAFGDEIYLIEDINNNGLKKYYHHILIAKDEIGHKILRRASSQAWENSFQDGIITRTPIERRQLAQIISEEGKGHIISSTACLGSFEAQKFLEIKLEEEVPFAQDLGEQNINRHKQEIVDFVEWNLEVFGRDDFYIEIAPNTSEEQRYVNRNCWNLAEAYDLKIIFTTDSHYLKESDRSIHKAYLNSKQAEREVDDFYYTAYMMSEEQVREYLYLDFTEEQVDVMISNLETMRKSIKHYTLLKEQEIPKVRVEVPDTILTLEEQSMVGEYESLVMLIRSEEEQDRYWIHSCLNEMKNRSVLNSTYLTQLNIEAATLVKISARLKQPMTSYYNTAQKIIQLMWEEGDSLVGVSRGSAMGFVSNWLLDVTQVNPIPYVGDMSWRHLSESRPELPK